MAIAAAACFLLIGLAALNGGQLPAGTARMAEGAPAASIIEAETGAFSGKLASFIGLDHGPHCQKG
ncbi:hypothetical protein KHP62_02010 [Rhodobacteraceae bacterium NNCM2]|nr:hypothetical protein [Coraliihabitans acroporae]